MNNPTIDEIFPKGLLRPELFIGMLASVSAQGVRFNLQCADAPSGSHFLGGRYGKGEVGEFVLIEGQTNVLLGRIVEVHKVENGAHNRQPKRKDESDASGSVQLLGTVAMDSLRVSAGVESYPRLGDRVYAAPHRFVAELPVLMEASNSEGPTVVLRLGSIDVASECEVKIRPEKLFGRHCAILGTTGGGKSWTTARVIEECIAHNCKIVLLDATGEYRGFSGQFVSNRHLGKPVAQALDSVPCSIPPKSFSEGDFMALFEPAGKVQGPKLRAAIRSLRLVTLHPSLATDGLLVKRDKLKAPIQAALRAEGVMARIDDPAQDFAVHKLARQIEEECVYPDGRKADPPNSKNFMPDPTKYGGDSGEFSFCLALVARINGVLTSPAFEAVFRSKDESLPEAIVSFLSSPKRLLRICLSGIAFEFNAREIIANAIGRFLLAHGRKGSYAACPVVVIVDEAHNFLGRHIGVEDFTTRLDAFELIAKEGRKFGLNICLSTQRPRDITEGVLSQMGTLVVHRLTNDSDRSVVERACGEIDRSASSFLPNLKPGEAAIIGADFPIPLTIQVLPPDVKPKSEGPNYQTCWRMPQEPPAATKEDKDQNSETTTNAEACAAEKADTTS